jgi:hypothetical protein
MPAPTATAGNANATVAFTTIPGITTYRAISTPGSFTGTSSTSPITVSGLTNGTAYTFQIRGENTAGNGAYSAASNSVTPIQPTAYESIATVTGTGSSNTITFSSIPTTYQHLQIRAIVRAAAGGTGGDNLYVRANGITTSVYSRHALMGNGSAVTASGAATQTFMTLFGSSYANYPTDGDLANTFGVMIIDIHDYASTSKYKTFRGLEGYDINGSGSISLGSGLYQQTTAISSITIYTNNNFTNTSRFALYGIKGS